MTIKQYIPKKKELKLLQARIRSDLYKKLRKRLKVQKETYRSFLEASIKHFLKEEK